MKLKTLKWNLLPAELRQVTEGNSWPGHCHWLQPLPGSSPAINTPSSWSTTIGSTFEKYNLQKIHMQKYTCEKYTFEEEKIARVGPAINTPSSWSTTIQSTFEKYNLQKIHLPKYICEKYTFKTNCRG